LPHRKIGNARHRVANIRASDVAIAGDGIEEKPGALICACRSQIVIPQRNTHHIASQQTNRQIGGRQRIFLPLR